MGNLSRSARVAAGLIAGSLIAGTPAAQAQQGSAPRCAGAPGVGDTYYPVYGNGGYDARHYDLNVGYDPATDVLRGRATIRARATQRLCRFDLDFVGLTIDKLTVNGKPARWRRSGQELIVRPRTTLRKGDAFKVRARYHGVPQEFTLPGTDIRTGFMTTPEGVTVAGQPEVAASWYPVNDHPIDKATYDFRVTVPNAYQVVANGFPRGHRRHGATTTWRWTPREPMASYLATFDVAKWDFSRGRTATGLPLYNAVDSGIGGGLRQQIDSSLSKQGEVLGLLSKNFGRYPFSTSGAIVPNQNDLLFALETQTRPVYSKLFWLDANNQPTNGDSVIVHELAHQWYGDDVALGRWQDIWLNEGFATYAEWLWAEHEGQGSPQDTFKSTYDALPADDPLWKVKIGDPGIDLLFDNAVYVRGAMTLQALRNEVGDAKFGRILKAWARRHSRGNGVTRQFIRLAERIAGRQLDDVFDTWLFTTGKPAFSTPKGATAATGQRSLAAPDTYGRRWLQQLNVRLSRGRY